MDHCTLCGGPLAFMGQLGHRIWHRCQDCGIDHHEPAEEPKGKTAAVKEFCRRHDIDYETLEA